MLLRKSSTNKRFSFLKALSIAIGVAYPFLVFYVLNKGVSLRLLGIFVALFISCNFLSYRKKYATIIGLLLSLSLFIYEDVLFLKIYPVIMNFIVTSTFILSLKNKHPLIEQFATKMGYVMDEEGKIYARKSTIAWSIFLFCNFTISFSTIFFSLEVWTLYNGLISYLLIGLALIIEYLSHQHRTIKC